MNCCTRCNAIFFTSPFISRKDGQTKICSDCELMEGLEATGMKAPYDGPQYWVSATALSTAQLAEYPAQRRF